MFQLSLLSLKAASCKQAFLIFSKEIDPPELKDKFKNIGG
jgi:hypothetical protein